MKRGHIESNILVLVTLALVAFGMVMVYSATSASAAIGGGNPVYYLKRQGLFALVGLVLLVLASRWKYQSLRHVAPMLVLGASSCSSPRSSPGRASTARAGGSRSAGSRSSPRSWRSSR